MHKDNLLPEPYKEINREEFMLHTLLYHTACKDEEFRQVYLSAIHSGGMWSTRIFWYDKRTVGYAITYMYVSLHTTKLTGEAYGKKKDYGYIVKYFKIGCTHSYKELNYPTCKARGIPHFGALWHVEECQNCGFINAYDSSG
jgi:hypothetical protein